MTTKNKIAVWGHWILGLLAAAMAAQSLWAIVGNYVFMAGHARFGRQVLYTDFQFAVLGTVCALCAWGILQWRPWGHVLALGIFAFEVYVGGLALLVGDSGPLYLIGACLVLTWLSLPSVRSAYWGKVQAKS
jgi:hypothetical protein